MITLFAFLATSYKLCPANTPFTSDLIYQDKRVKPNTWNYFYFPINSTHLKFRINITCSGNASFYMGKGNICPTEEDKPFFETEQTNFTSLTFWKPSLNEVPIGVYAKERLSLTINIETFPLKIDYAKWLIRPITFVFLLYCTIQFIYFHIEKYIPSKQIMKTRFQKLVSKKQEKEKKGKKNKKK